MYTLYITNGDFIQILKIVFLLKNSSIVYDEPTHLSNTKLYQLPTQ